jgi:phosphotransferase system  glucose/maltose/N-acetylglucosamine-specific IIC component
MELSKRQIFTFAVLVAIVVVIKLLVEYLVSGLVMFCVIYTMKDVYKHWKKSKGLAKYSVFFFRGCISGCSTSTMFWSSSGRESRPQSLLPSFWS